jgi:hypothetical protein
LAGRERLFFDQMLTPFLGALPSISGRIPMGRPLPKTLYEALLEPN